MSDEAKKNWIGIGRFFRALEFSEKVNRYGDFPWYGDLVDAGDIQNLYKPRDSRTLVMDSILSDFKYAAENVRISDPTTGPKGLIVNKDVVLAFMSRIMLREGTWQKYHNGNQVMGGLFESGKMGSNVFIVVAIWNFS